jgi:hypothetical protein
MATPYSHNFEQSRLDYRERSSQVDYPAGWIIRDQSNLPDNQTFWVRESLVIDFLRSLNITALDCQLNLRLSLESWTYDAELLDWV